MELKENQKTVSRISTRIIVKTWEYCNVFTPKGREERFSKKE